MPKRRPFWLPASSYYVLAFAVGLAIFFLLWGILHDGGEETPWITAGIAFSAFMVGAVVLRELFLRRARNRYQAVDKQFESQLVDLHLKVGDRNRPEKLTIERNNRILADIRQKSEAAKVLGKFSGAHREVFEVCGEYLAVNEREMRTIGIGSPRLAALRKGKESVTRFHRFHLLQWAQIEARNLTQEASNHTKFSDKVTATQNALGVVDSALEHYPAESALLESQELLREMLISIKVSDLVEKAEKTAFKGDNKQAISLYRDALFYLGRDNVRNEQRETAAERINSELERIRRIEDKN